MGGRKNTRAKYQNQPDGCEVELRTVVAMVVVGVASDGGGSSLAYVQTERLMESPTGDGSWASSHGWVREVAHPPSSGFPKYHC